MRQVLYHLRHAFSPCQEEAALKNILKYAAKSHRKKYVLTNF
jgi:hypothetical protein